MLLRLKTNHAGWFAPRWYNEIFRFSVISRFLSYYMQHSIISLLFSVLPCVSWRVNGVFFLFLHTLYFHFIDKIRREIICTKVSNWEGEERNLWKKSLSSGLHKTLKLERTQFKRPRDRVILINQKKKKTRRMMKRFGRLTKYTFTHYFAWDHFRSHWSKS